MLLKISKMEGYLVALVKSDYGDFMREITFPFVPLKTVFFDNHANLMENIAHIEYKLQKLKFKRDKLKSELERLKISTYYIGK